MSTEGQRSRNARIEAKVTSVSGCFAAGGTTGDKGPRPALAKGEPVDMEKELQRAADGGSADSFSASAILSDAKKHVLGV